LPLTVDNAVAQLGLTHRYVTADMQLGSTVNSSAPLPTFGLTDIRKSE
jgi:hypothetical protein